MKNKIINGDSLEEMKNIEEGSIDLIFADPPYWMRTEGTLTRVEGTDFKGTRLQNSHETLIWATKNKKSKFTFNYKTAKELNFDSINEDEYVKGVRKQMGFVWKFSVCSGSERLKDDNGIKLHNTQKPQELLERIIAISSNIDDLVLDPFAGTMTTASATKKLGRNYIMIEQDIKYCEYGKRRLENITFDETAIAKAEYDIKPLKVKVSNMIKSKFLIEGEWFYSKEGEPIAQLCDDGKLKYNGEIVDMHSCIALVKNVKAKRLNGFDHWYVKRDDNLVPISKIRENYREEMKISLDK